MRIKLVLVGTEGAVNLGFVLRLAMNFGVDEIVLVSPKVSPEEYDTVRRYAAKASGMLDKVRTVSCLDEAFEENELKACTTAKQSLEGDVLRESITPEELAEIARGWEKVALVFGRESTGLTRKELAMCDATVTIPADPVYPVLNLSHAIAVILYVLYRSQSKPKVRIASPQSLRFLTESFNELVDLVDHEKNRAERAKIAFKHVVGKCMLTESEAKLLSFVFRRASRAISRNSGEEK